MNRSRRRYSINRVDVQVSIFTAVIVTLSCLTIYGYQYRCTYRNMIDVLTERTNAIHNYVDSLLLTETFSKINSPKDMDTEVYREIQEILYNIKQSSEIQYLYTAKQAADGSFVYVVDGLNPDAPDFRKPGDSIEEEIVPELKRAMSGEMVLPDDIKDTGWGKIFIAYLPVHDEEKVIGVLGVEFSAQSQYNAYRAVRLCVPVIIVAACLTSILFAVVFFRRISNPLSMDLYNTDYLTQLKNRNAFETDINNLNVSKSRQNAGVIVIDLNDLKKVNDRMGHDAGDTYLQIAAAFFRRMTPPNGVVYRIGGDEFTFVLSETNEEAVEQLYHKLVETFPALSPGDWEQEISLSAGYTLFDPMQDQNISDTCKRADQMMYREKKRYHERN